MHNAVFMGMCGDNVTRMTHLNFYFLYDKLIRRNPSSENVFRLILCFPEHFLAIKEEKETKDRARTFRLEGLQRPEEGPRIFCWRGQLYWKSVGKKFFTPKMYIKMQINFFFGRGHVSARLCPWKNHEEQVSYFTGRMALHVSLKWKLIKKNYGF